MPTSNANGRLRLDRELDDWADWLLAEMSGVAHIQADEIILFTPFIGALGGVERLLLGLSSTLDSAGYRHRVACFEDTIDLASHAGWPLTVEQLKPRRSPLAEARALRKWLGAASRAGSATPLLFDIRSAFYAGLSGLPPFVLHLTDPPSLLPTDASKQSYSARQRYSPFAALPRPSWRAAIYGELVHRLNRRGARRARQVLAMTHRVAAELNDLYGVTPEIIRPGVSDPPAASQRSWNGRLNLLSVSRLEGSKRIDWIVKALVQLEGVTPALGDRADWCLHIVGQGSQRDALEALAASSGMQGRVIFHGQVDDRRLEELYCESDLFLMPAVQGYGLPALEALARDVPVVLHRDSGVAEILQGNRWAELIDGGYHDLARAISLMVDRLQTRSLESAPQPTVPTEKQWSLQVAGVCGWSLANPNSDLKL